MYLQRQINSIHCLKISRSISYRKTFLRGGFDLLLEGIIKIRRKLSPSLAVAIPDNGMQ
jgi:hypothetical protein